MHLFTSLLVLLLPLGTVAVPKPDPFIHAMHQNEQRTLPSIPLAVIPSPPLKIRADTIAAGSDAKTGAAIRARQLAAGAAAGAITLMDDIMMSPQGNQGGEPLPSSESQQSQTTSSLPQATVAVNRPAPSTCPNISTDSYYSPLEVQNVSISSPPNATISFVFTDRLEGYNSSTVCFVNATCSVPLPDLHLQVSASDASNSTNATSFATITKLPDELFINCSKHTMGFTIGKESGQPNSIVIINLMHLIYTNQSITRSAFMAIDLDSGLDVETSSDSPTLNPEFLARRNLTDGSNNNTWVWQQASDVWYSDASNLPANMYPEADSYPGVDLLI